jgi:hypothetical protein
MGTSRGEKLRQRKSLRGKRQPPPSSSLSGPGPQGNEVRAKPGEGGPARIKPLRKRMAPKCHTGSNVPSATPGFSLTEWEELSLLTSLISSIAESER